jgi:hypothetical protein
MGFASTGRDLAATYDGRTPNDHGAWVSTCSSGAYCRKSHHAPGFGAPSRCSIQPLLWSRDAKSVVLTTCQTSVKSDERSEDAGAGHVTPAITRRSCNGPSPDTIRWMRARVPIVGHA